MKEKRSRLDWIDGLRLAASLFIFADHYFLYFLPVSYYGRRIEATEFAYRMAESPLTVWINGNFWVCVFCVVSGLVAALKVFRNAEDPRGPERIGSAAVNRYLRLALPSFAMSAMVFVMLKLGLMKNLAFGATRPSPWADILYYQYKLESTVLTLLLDAFIRVPFAGSEKYCIALWTIPFLLFGYLFSLVLAQMGLGKSRRVLLVYALFALGLLLTGREIEACFPLGTALAYLLTHGPEKQSGWVSLLGAGLLLAGLFFGGYPTEVVPRGVYAPLTVQVLDLEPFMIWHLLGSALLMAGVMYCRPVRRFLGLRRLAQMGRRLSFSMYLLHIALITSVSSAAVIALLQRTALPYMTIFWLMFAATLLLLLPLSWLFDRAVIAPSGKLTAAFERFLQEKSERERKDR